MREIIEIQIGIRHKHRVALSLGGGDLVPYIPDSIRLKRKTVIVLEKIKMKLVVNARYRLKGNIVRAFGEILISELLL